MPLSGQQLDYAQCHPAFRDVTSSGDAEDSMIQRRILPTSKHSTDFIAEVARSDWHLISTQAGEFRACDTVSLVLMFYDNRLLTLTPSMFGFYR